MAKPRHKTSQARRPPKALDRGMNVVKFQPRGRQQRASGRSVRARRLAIAVLGVLIAVGLAYAGIRLAVDPRFALERIDVSGAARTGDGQIVAAAAIAPETNVWLVNAGAVETRLAALPWVSSARMSRSWPNRLSIAVNERTPVARLELRTGALAADMALLDAEARVLQVGGLAPDDERLPLMRIDPTPQPVRTGERLRSPELMGALEAGRRLAALGVHISEVSSEPSSGISVVTDSGLRAIFGDSDELERKATLFLAIARRISHPDDVSYVDVRSTSAPTVLYR